MAHILVIDDDPPLRSALAEILQVAGHTVTVASDGLEGAQLYRAHHADIVLCDLVMRHSGLALIRILMEQYPDCRIIDISGVAANKLAYALESGAKRTLKKPFTPDELIEAINKTLGESPAPAGDVRT
jgi:CheY-like chemotaxis protein